MTNRLQDLVAKLRLDGSEFQRGLQQARGQAQGFGTQLKSALMPVAAALGAAFSAQAIFGQLRQGMQEIDQVAKSARAVGGSIGGFRALELAAGESGVAIETLREQLQNMDRQIASGRAEPALRALGLEAKALQAVDADERMAMLADRIKELGASTGQSLALLQAFGIENRDMSLLMMQGGDAIRAARADVQDYGLALSAVDAASVERANDQLGRLAIVGRMLRQEMAAGAAPALGELARAISDSVREGGALRALIEGLADRTRTLSNLFGNTGSILVSMADWFRQLSGEGGILGTALSAVGTALTGLFQPFGRVLDAMASGVTWFADLIRGSGGFGEALTALGALATAVWDGMKISAGSLVPAMGAVWRDLEAAFYGMLSRLSEEWSRFLTKIAGAMRDVPGLGTFAGTVEGAAGNAMGGSAEFDAKAAGASRSAAGLRGEAQGMLTTGGNTVLGALENLRSIVKGYRDSAAASGEAADSALRFNSALGDLSGGGAKGAGGSLAGKARESVNSVTEAMRQMQSAMEQVKSSVGNAFVGLVTGANSLRQTLSNLLMDFAKLLANRAFEALWKGGLGGGGGGGLMGIFGGLLGLRSFDGGGHTGYGARTGGLDGKGGFMAMLHPNETVIDHTRGQRTQDVQVVVTMDPSTGMLGAFVDNRSGRIIKAAVPQMIGASMAKARERGFSN